MMGTPFALLATFLLAVGANGQAVTTMAGSGVQGSADGTGAAATFNNPRQITYSPDGTTALVADTFNHKIRKIDVASEAVTTLAGSGVRGSADGTGAAATFQSPFGITYSPDGTTALVADSDNHKIRKIDVASEAVTTLAGSGVQGSADGTGANATFYFPRATTYSPDGTTVLVADSWTHKIRKIDVASEAVTTLAGSGVGGSADGTGAAATFQNPSGITYSPDGFFAVACAPHSLRRIELVAVCSQPTDTTGFTSIVETQLNVATGFAVTAQCADNYQGDATVDACTSSGPYSLTGCSAIEPTKTSSAPTVAASVVGMIVSALVTATFN